MNYRLKQLFVWSLVALIAFANCIIFWPILKLLFNKPSSQELQTIEQMNVSSDTYANKMESVNYFTLF